MTTPIFIFSMPRSGSTLLQRILCSSPDVESAPETWFLFHLLEPVSRVDSLSVINANVCNKAVEEFLRSTPSGEEEYLKKVSKLAVDMYCLRSGNAHYFVDKTPRYSLIADQIFDAFGEKAKYIVLTRNPLAAGASMIQSWGAGKWNLYKYLIDLYDLPINLSNFMKEKSGLFFEVSYEELVREPGRVMAELSEYLGIEIPSTDVLPEEVGGVRVGEGFGDRTGVNKYKKISRDNEVNWGDAYSPILRRMWMKKYVGKLNKKLANEFKLELPVTNNKRIFSGFLSDAIRMIYGVLATRYAFGRMTSKKDGRPYRRYYE